MATQEPDEYPVGETVQGAVSFGAALTLWREHRRTSKKKLAAAMGFDPSYISHVEAGRHAAGEEFARKAESVLNAGGALWRAWRAEGTVRAPGAAVVEGLVVDEDHARLHYDGRLYRPNQRRRLFNGGAEPVTRYLMRISVDRYPGQPERSNALYRARPLTFDELALTASCDGEPMIWRPKQDRDSFKEAWLCLENERGRFPLYPGQRALLEYGYAVDDQRWGLWFQRAVRLPTRHLSVELVFPAALDPMVWGTETSTTAEAVPLRTPIFRSVTTIPDEVGEQVVFTWATDDPPVGARYRLEWRFRARDGDADQPRPELRTASDRMKAAGIVQHGDPILSRAARLFDLPAEAEAASDVLDRLFAAMQRVREHHVFGKGMGLAAPQIGISRAAAIVQPPDPNTEPLVLLNPRVIGSSAETDEQYEGCLSFFDVRGLVPRPLRLEVEHTRLDGQRSIIVLDTGLARLAGHEIDHLYGRLYTHRMRDGVEPIPVEQYRGTGQAWSYR
ncbi:peptide deformylase [Actinomadura litoris]|uniref:peptide deformylase n=1 Tax=Actinomadura litoris TaxID=2678616 RepID=UPI001FA6AD97|nr:peptide deformylase [Actinomadura litoris]